MIPHPGFAAAIESSAGPDKPLEFASEPSVKTTCPPRYALFHAIGT